MSGTMRFLKKKPKDEDKKEESPKEDDKKEKKEKKDDKKEDKKKDDKKDDKKKEKEEKKKKEEEEKKKKEEEEKEKKKKEEEEKKKKKEGKDDKKKDDKKKDDKKDEKKDDKKDEKKETPKDDKKLSPRDLSKKEESKRDLLKKETSKTEVAASPTTPRKKEGDDVLEGEEAVEEELTFFRLINNSTFSDVTFFIGQNQQKLYAHHCVLEARCASLMRNGKKKKNLTEVEVPSGIGFDTMIQIMHHVYTGKVDFPNLKELDIVLLLSACVGYEGLNRLKFECEAYLKKIMTIKNVHSLLKAVDEHSLKFKEVVLHFAVQNYADFIANKNATKDLGITLFQDAVTLYQQHLTGDLKPLPMVEEPANTFIEDFKKLYDHGKMSDINFKMAEANLMGISGTMYKCHKALLIGRVPALMHMVNQTQTEVSKGVSAVTVKGMTTEAFEAVLKWVYFHEMTVPVLPACELVTFNKKYKMVTLQKACVESMKKGINVESVLIIMDVAAMKEMPNWFNEEMKGLKPRCIDYAKEHLTEIDFEKIRAKKMSRSIAPDILIALQKKSE